MSSVIGALRVNLGLDSAQFATGLKRAGGQARGFQSQMATVAARVGKMAAGMASAMGAAAVAMGASAVRAGAEIQRLAQVANVDTTQFQGWAAGAKSVGIEQEKLADILKDTNDKLGDFVQTGGGAMADFFEKVAPKVGVTAEQFRKLGGADALQLYVSSLEKANLSQQDMTFYMEAIASDSTLLLPLLRNGGAAMAEYAQKAADMGAILSGPTLSSLNKGKLALDDMQLAMQGMRNTIGVMAVPAIQALASAITSAASFFHQHAQTIGDVMRTLAGSVAVLATAFAVKYALAVGVTAVRSMVLFVQQSIALQMALGATSRAAALAGVASVTFSRALIMLRTAIISTGIGALVVAAGYLVGKFVELVGAAGGFGNAIRLVGNIAVEVWKRIGFGLEGLGRSISSIAAGIKASFAEAFAWVVSKLADMTEAVAQGINAMFAKLGFDPGLTGMGRGLADSIAKYAKDERDVAARQSDAASVLYKAATAPLKSWQELKGVMDAANTSTTTLTTNAAPLGAALEDAGKKGKEAADKIKETMNRGADAIGNMFGSLLDGSKSLRASVADLIMEIAKMQAMKGFRGLFGEGGAFSGVGKFLGGLLSLDGARADGGPVRAGGSYLVGERGPEIFSPATSGAIIPNHALGAGQSAIRIELGEGLVGSILQQAAGQSVQIVQTNNQLLPDMIAQHQRNPRQR